MTGSSYPTERSGVPVEVLGPVTNGRATLMLTDSDWTEATPPAHLGAWSDFLVVEIGTSAEIEVAYAAAADNLIGGRNCWLAPNTLTPLAAPLPAHKVFVRRLTDNETRVIVQAKSAGRQQ